MKKGAFCTIMVLLAFVALLMMADLSSGGALKAPPGMFMELNDEILGDAIIVRSKQLFIDDYIIENLDGAEKILNQPTKHPKNPLIVPDQPWEKEGSFANGTVMYDEQEKIFKMWYVIWLPDPEKKGSKNAGYGYAISKDGITWEKPAINDNGTSAVMLPKVKGQTSAARIAQPELGPVNVFKDMAETDPQRRYKLFYIEKADGTAKTLSNSVGYSPDGLRFTAEPKNPVISFSDTQANCYWDPLARRYVAYLRYGPPNVRAIARIESEDFIHWSPKVTVLPQLKHKLDKPRSTMLYGMRIMPYEGVNIGFIVAYHGETISKIPKEKEAWMDKSDVQLAVSRNGLTWSRVGKNGVITPEQYKTTGVLEFDAFVDKLSAEQLRVHIAYGQDSASAQNIGAISDHLTANTWSHVVITWDAGPATGPATGKYSMIVDGVTVIDNSDALGAFTAINRISWTNPNGHVAQIDNVALKASNDAIVVGMSAPALADVLVDFETPFTSDDMTNAPFSSRGGGTTPSLATGTGSNTTEVAQLGYNNWLWMDDFPPAEQHLQTDWMKASEEAAFIPWGRHKVDWDWGQIYVYQKPLIVGDEIWIYYTGLANRHWASYHGDTIKSGVGLAKLRLDGFVSVNAENEGTMTTKPFVFIGDALELNANATGGSIIVEAIGADGKVIEGFSKEDCQPITTDNVRHILKWSGSEDCHLIQARPIKLRFTLEKAKLYSFTPRIRHEHYIQSYD
jgi:hypothetical protein